MGGGLVLVLVATRFVAIIRCLAELRELNEDKHKAPSSTPLHPLSLQNRSPQNQYRKLHQIFSLCYTLVGALRRVSTNEEALLL
jgi:hypothetical protein